VAGGPGQLGAVGSGLDRDRWGVLAGIRDPRLTLAAHYIGFRGEGETGNNTFVSPRAVFDTAGRVLSLYAIARPLAFHDSTLKRFGVLGRWDRITTNTRTDAGYHIFIGGVTFDLSPRATISLDYQEQLTDRGTPVGGGIVLPATAPLKTYFLHLVANF
jgi:hypothetical protein